MVKILSGLKIKDLIGGLNKVWKLDKIKKTVQLIYYFLGKKYGY
jgi:hypothetical protein